MKIWIAVLAVSAATFALRASFIVFADPQRFPRAFRHALKFVPPSVLAAIVALGLALPAAQVELSAHNLRLMAGLIALVATIFARSTLSTIAIGMTVLWALQWVTRHLG
jgi:branched-subunit amino acid transport protein